jgi:serine/threonine-protein kinase
MSQAMERATAEPDLSPPDVGAGLKLRRLLARGGFAEVWEAEQTSLGRRVAVKILRTELLAQEQMVQLFEQEARVLARLNHPNVVQVIDRGVSPRGPYFVMEFVEGNTLQEFLSRGNLSTERALTILLQAARGLSYAHRNGVIHRDVKPANILVSRAGQVKISDFGIAAVHALAASPEEDEEETGPRKRTALGTRTFMAPEQRVSFDDVGPEADIYSMGVVLHRILTGKLPPGPGRLAQGARVPQRLQPILERSLSAAPGRRYPSAGAFREALVNALGGRHIEDRVRRGAASALGTSGRFELLDVLRQDERRSVYLVRKGGSEGERIVVKRYLKDANALQTVRSLARVEHPHIIRVLAVGERDDSFIMLMEHMSGGDLRERMAKPHPWEEAVAVGKQVALALSAAHQQGIVHGNLRPSNVMYDAEGRVRVTDFGLPEHYAEEPDRRNWYAAPEGERSQLGDVYALGAILYEMLFATPVPEDPSLLFLESRRKDDVPEALKDVLRRLLAPAAQRYHTAELVAQDLAMLLDDEQRSQPVPVDQAERGEPARRPTRPSVDPGSLVIGAVSIAGLSLLWLLDQPRFTRWVEEVLAPLF